jgi:hypothetical protein
MGLSFVGRGGEQGTGRPCGCAVHTPTRMWGSGGEPRLKTGLGGEVQNSSTHPIPGDSFEKGEEERKGHPAGHVGSKVQWGNAGMAEEGGGRGVWKGTLVTRSRK